MEHSMIGGTTKTIEEKKVSTTNGEIANIIVYNDDQNTFSHVIRTFQEILKHTFDQAEQCSVTIHFAGKAQVKSGSFKELKPMKDALIEEGLSAVIDREVI